MKKLNIRKKVLALMLLSFIFNISLQGQDTITVFKITDPDQFLYRYNYVDSLCAPEMLGTLQWAIRKRNDSPADSVVIVFNIPGLGPHVIYLYNYLPALTKPITIDGSTQPGYNYNNGPSIIIDGTYIPYNSACFNISANSSVIKGLLIRNFYLSTGIYIWGSNSKIINNVFQNVGGYDPAYYRAMGVYIAAPNCIIQGNVFGTDITGTENYGSDAEAIYLQNQWLPADNCIIGGSGVNEPNIIANSGSGGGWAGISITNGKHNRISRNRIYNNPIGIQLMIYGGPAWWGNEGKTAPVITSATANTVSGTSAPNDIIEVFGSTGNENANEYLTTTIADSLGNWTAQATTTYPNVIATGTDGSNNTSIFSQSFIYQENKWIRIAIKDNSAIPINGVLTSDAILNDILLNFNVDTFYQTFSFTSHQELKKYYTIHTLFEPEQLLDTLSKMTNLFLFVDFWSKHSEVYTSTEGTDFWDPTNWATNWHLYDINAQGAWDITHGCPDIKIGVVDSKIAGLHEEINSKLLYPYDPLSGYSFVNNCYFPMGDHGTRVAGTAAGATDNSLGIASIGFNTKLVAYEWRYHCDALGNLDYTLQPWDYAFQACLHAAEVEKVDILNISWLENDCAISPGSVLFYNNLIEAINSEGTVIVVAGGNQSTEDYLNDPLNCPPGWNNWYPYNPPPFSKYVNNKVIVVSGINRFDNYDASEFYEQQATDICAPGVMFLAPSSNDFINPPCPQNNNYAAVRGTSFSTPIVSGTIALMKCVNPCLTLEQIRQILISTANPINNGTSYSQYIGGGRLNAQAAVQLAQNTVPITPSPNFTTNNLCIDNPVQFTYTGTFVTSWQWDFGDGTSSTQQNPSHTYSLPGNYQVILTVSNSCGTSNSMAQFIYIYPNCCALPTNIAYDDDNPLLSSPITSSTIWNSSYNNFKINKTIVVQAPAILTIQSGVTIEFGPLGKIIVENGTSSIAGAQLVMQINSKFTSITKSIPSCHVMWQGVEVWGVYANNSFNSLGQGKITMALGAAIENAHIGVLLGKTNICYPPPPPCPPPCIQPLPCSPWELHHGGRSGGIIIANGANFNNNAVSIRFLPYSKNNTSRIQNSSFSATNLLDLGYKTGNSYTYPNNYNRYYAPHNLNGIGAWHTHLWKVNNVRFYDNTFNTVWAEAILAFDSRLYVNKLTSPNGNSFNNSYYYSSPYYPSSVGVHILNTISSPSYFHEISSNTFGNTSNIPHNGIYIEGNQGSDLITNNFFNYYSSPPTPYAQAGGVYLINSSGFSVYNNYFNMLDVGLVVTNSGIGGGNVGFPGGNIFTKCRHSVYTLGPNTGPNSGNPNLQIKCNRFDNPDPQYYTTYSYNIQSGDNIADQGSYPIDQSEDKKLAGNEFWQVQGPVPNPNYRNDIISSNDSYNYYRHHLDVIGGWTILPHDAVGNSLISIIENPNVNKTATSCSIEPCLPPCTIFTQLNTQAAQLQIFKQEFNTVFANLDKGQTAQLITAINSNIPLGQLKNMMLNNSPLSDEVLFAFINRQILTSPGIFKEAITPNMPVSDTVNKALLLKLNILPPGIANQIRNLQGYNPGFRTLTAILRDIGTIENERAQTLSQIISYYVQNDSLNILTALLEQEGTDYANQLLAGLYLSEGNLSLASSKLSLLPNSTPSEHAYININNMLITLASGAQTVFEMDSIQEQMVRQIATMNTSCLARTNARAILLLVYNERFEEEMPQLLNARMAGNNSNNTGLTNSDTYFSIYPNPASENVELHYNLTESDNGQLEIFSIIGNKVASYVLPSAEESINISVKSFDDGIYMYRFSVNGEMEEEGKLIIIK
ncbi:MAG: hypothetical protein A2X08_18115 [Bacteroidetes bacterium GWA2_32_17]|nr:MAG: hypothetical protein A2X08_18115 [Bacteroidetes bacterium GWA2_32_17]